MLTLVTHMKRTVKPYTANSWIEEEKSMTINDAWLENSSRIAITVLDELRKTGMTKQELAEKMEVKPQFVSRIVKGSVNLTLETIAKLEVALNLKILKVEDTTEVIRVEAAKKTTNYWINLRPEKESVFHIKLQTSRIPIIGSKKDFKEIFNYADSIQSFTDHCAAICGADRC